MPAPSAHTEGSCCSALHRLIEAAQAAAVRCDASALWCAHAELEVAFAARLGPDSDYETPSKIELQQLRARLTRYTDLCAALGSTLRRALEQASLTDSSRYAKSGGEQTARLRHLVGGYG